MEPQVAAAGTLDSPVTRGKMLSDLSDSIYHSLRISHHKLRKTLLQQSTRRDARVCQFFASSGHIIAGSPTLNVAANLFLTVARPPIDCYGFDGQFGPRSDLFGKPGWNMRPFFFGKASTAPIDRILQRTLVLTGILAGRSRQEAVNQAATMDALKGGLLLVCQKFGHTRPDTRYGLSCRHIQFLLIFCQFRGWVSFAFLTVGSMASLPLSLGR